jgi:hypothetical protein
MREIDYAIEVLSKEQNKLKGELLGGKFESNEEHFYLENIAMSEVVIKLLTNLKEK